MEKLAFNCTECNSKDVKYVKGKEITISSKNPGVAIIKTDCYECQVCGETYLDEKASKKVAVELDKKC